MSDMKNQYKLTVPVGSTDLTFDTAISGWLDIVHWHFAADVSGLIGMQIKRTDGNYMVIANDTAATESEMIWQGNYFVNNNDIVRFNNDTGEEATVYITIGYELAGTGAWTGFAGGAGDDSSSSSSVDSSSSSSSSSESTQSSSSSSSQSNSSSSSSKDSSSSSSSVGYSSSSSSVGNSSSSSSVDSSSSSSVSYTECNDEYVATLFPSGDPSINDTYTTAGIYNGASYYAGTDYYLFLANTNPDYWAISGDVGDPSNQWVTSKDTSGGCPNGAYVGAVGTVT